MQLIYCYIKHFRNIINQEVYFSDQYKVFYNGSLRVTPQNPDHVQEIIYKNSNLKNLHILVGKTGAGKTNLLQLIGMPEEIRLESSMPDDSYFLLYEAKGCFVAELFHISINSFEPEKEAYTDTSRLSPQLQQYFALKHSMKMFRFSCSPSGTPVNIKAVRFPDTDHTYIFNSFDRNAFAICPYPDEREEGTSTNTDWLARYAAPYHRTALFYSCKHLKEYIDSFSEGNIKRKAALIIRRNNWADSIKVHLDDALMASDYWLFADRIKKQEESRFLGKKTVKKKLPSIKHQFVHDLWTDYAIYLRKWIAYIESYGHEDIPGDRLDYTKTKDVYQEYLDYAYEKEYGDRIDPSDIPDFEKMSIVKRLEWLAQYIDRKGDGVAHGLVWQIFTDLKDIGNYLNQFDDKYFTNDEFVLPIEEMYTEKNKLLVEDLFERMMQYRPDDTGIFTRELLPYRFSCISSGEWQYAKVLGGLEEYCIQLSVGNKEKPNLIFLFDEPETYMHPELCRKFLYYTEKLLEKRHTHAQMQLIISTHSPFLLSDVLPGQITRFDMDDLGYCIIKNNSQKQYFGANIHTILSDGFFLEYTIGEYARVFLQDAFQWLKTLTERQDTLLTDDEQKRIQEIRQIVPVIGDDMIRKSFENMLRHFI